MSPWAGKGSGHHAPNLEQLEGVGVPILGVAPFRASLGLDTVTVLS